MADLFDLSIDTSSSSHIAATDKDAAIRKAATHCMPGLIQDTLSNKAVDLNEAIRGYWLMRIGKMNKEELLAMMHKYTLGDKELEAVLRKIEE